MLYLWIFLGAFVQDIFWTLYIRKVATGKPIISAFLSVAILLIGGYITINFVKNYFLLLPAGIGAFVATLITIYWDRRGHERTQKLPKLRRIQVD
jgi:hypothetical protein